VVVKLVKMVDGVAPERKLAHVRRAAQAVAALRADRDGPRAGG